MSSFEVDEVNRVAANWWDDEGFPFIAPWWFRYPAGVVALIGAYYVANEVDGLNVWAGWAVGTVLTLIGLGLIRELFVLILGLIALWWLGTVAVDNPIPAAIIFGAMIIAHANK